MRTPKLKLAFENEKKFEGSYLDYLAALLEAIPDVPLRVYGHVGRGRVPVVALETSRTPEVVVSTGFHGEEQAGPLSILTHGRDLFAQARSLGVGLRIYPCVNPTAFERARRRNDRDEGNNNTFLQYKAVGGPWAGGLKKGEEREGLRPDPTMPEETEAFYQEVLSHPAPKAFLDIHQDVEMRGSHGVYAYVVGHGISLCQRLIREVSSLAKPLVGYKVDATGRKGDEKRVVGPDGLLRMENGGGSQELFLERGTPISATLETDTDLPLDRAMAVNRIWVLGFLEHVAGMAKEASVFDKCMFGFSDELLKLAARGPHTYTDRHGNVYDVKKLWKASEGLPVEHVDYGPLTGPTARKLVAQEMGKGHERRLLKADLKYPILISPDGDRMDGNHRIAKAIREGYKTLPAVRFTKEQVEGAIIKKAAKAPTVAQKVDAHFGSEKKDWNSFEQGLNSAKFRKLVKGHPDADKKLQQYVQNVGAYLNSKKVVDKVRSRTSGQVYEIRKLPNGRLGCGCKDWQYKHSHKGSDCDHIEMARSGMKKISSSVAALGAGMRMMRMVEKSKKKLREAEQNRLRWTGRLPAQYP